MEITIDLNDDQAQKLRELAESLGVNPDELARAVCADLLTQPKPDYEKAAAHVLQKNRELYDRLG